MSVADSSGASFAYGYVKRPSVKADKKKANEASFSSYEYDHSPTRESKPSTKSPDSKTTVEADVTIEQGKNMIALLSSQAVRLEHEDSIHFVLKSAANENFLEAVNAVESEGYWVEWAPSLREKYTDVWMKLAGETPGKGGANTALVLVFAHRGLHPVAQVALNIGGEAPQQGQLVPDLAVYANDERQRQLGGGGRARHSRLVVEIEWLSSATVALNKAAVFLSDAFYGPDDTRVLEVWVVLIPKIPPPRPAADLLAPGVEAPLGPLNPFGGALPAGAGVNPPAVVVYFSRNNMFYEPAYAPVLWDHMVQVPAGPLGVGPFSANDFLNRAYTYSDY